VPDQERLVEHHDSRRREKVHRPPAKPKVLSHSFQDLYCVRSDLGNLLKALGRLDEAKVTTRSTKNHRNKRCIELGRQRRFCVPFSTRKNIFKGIKLKLSTYPGGILSHDP
jgi:hypothetical protein